MKRKSMSDRTKVYEDQSSHFPSLTVPDEAMTIPYLLAKYVKGTPLGVQEKVPVNVNTDNFDSPDWEKVKQMDLIDHEDFRSQLSEIETAHAEQQARKKLANQQKQSNLPKPPEGNAEARADKPVGDGAAGPA